MRLSNINQYNRFTYEGKLAYYQNPTTKKIYKIRILNTLLSEVVGTAIVENLENNYVYQAEIKDIWLNFKLLSLIYD